MKRLKHMLTFALLALLMAACSEDNALESSSTEGVEETVPVTFTATVDYSIGEPGGGAKASTRADEGETPTRFYAQAVTAAGELSAIAEGEANADGTYEFTLRLAPKTSYTYMFWADNATENDKPTDLRNVTYDIGTVAFAATVGPSLPEEVTKDITLKHVVTKVTLRHDGTNTFSPMTGDELGITLPCASAYNVQGGTTAGSGNTPQTARHIFDSDAPITQATDICTTYTLAPQSTDGNVTLTFRGGYTMAISGVTLSPNTRVTLNGDLSSENTNWEGEASEAARWNALESCFYNEDGKPGGKYETLVYCFYINNVEDIQRLFQEIFRREPGVVFPGGISISGHTIYCNNYDVTGIAGVYITIDSDDFILSANSSFSGYPPLEVPTLSSW